MTTVHGYLGCFLKLACLHLNFKAPANKVRVCVCVLARNTDNFKIWPNDRIFFALVINQRFQRCDGLALNFLHAFKSGWFRVTVKLRGNNSDRKNVNPAECHARSETLPLQKAHHSCLTQQEILQKWWISRHSLFWSPAKCIKFILFEFLKEQLGFQLPGRKRLLTIFIEEPFLLIAAQYFSWMRGSKLV